VGLFSKKYFKVARSAWTFGKWKVVEAGGFWGDEDVDGLPLFDSYEEALRVAKDLAGLKHLSSIKSEER
jgi:hypothetical protein